MARMLTSESRRLYSWWWDSHISPKNSKWLQENLADMDTRVKSMIKLIEEDADSFARRAEMYYKKRPELMKLVEEFYRAYRALAERYDYATSELRHAQKTLQAAFPDQEPFTLPEDSLSSTDPDPQKHESFGLQLFPEGNLHNIINEKDECEVERLKKAVADLIAERDSLFVQYQFSLGKLSSADDELNQARERSRILEEKANKAENEVHMLKESLILTKQMEHPETISDLEEKIVMTEEEAKMFSEKAVKAEMEVEKLKTALLELTEEKEGLRVLYGECLEKSHALELDLSSARSDVRRLTDEILNSTKKLKHVEEMCVRLETSNQSLKMKIMLKDQELSDKDNEFAWLKERLEKEAALQSGSMQKEIFDLKEEITQLELTRLNPESVQKRLSVLENRFMQFEKEKELKEELDESVIAQFENFILHNLIKEVEEENYCLSVENRKHMEASKLADKLISELEREILEQQVEEELLLVEVEILKSGVYQVFLSLGVGSNPAKMSIEDIINNIKGLKRSLLKEEDDKQRMLIENTVIYETMKGDCLKVKKENLDLVEVNENLGLELVMLDEERENEVELWDAEAAKFISDIQISNTRVLFESKVNELVEVCESLEGESASKDQEIEEMKLKASVMEREIEELKAQLLAYTPVIGSLKENISSLEHNVHTMAKLIASNNRKAEVQDVEVNVHPHQTQTNPELTQDPKPLEPNGISNLINFQTRIAALEKVIVQDIKTVRRCKTSTININTKPKPAKPETEEPKSYDHQKRNKEEKLRGKRCLTLDHLNIPKAKPEFSEVRDIQLDQASDGSSSANSRSKSRRGYLRSDDMLIEHLQMAHKIYETESKSRKLPYEPQIEDPGVYKVQLSNQEYKKGKLLQRLASEAHKLGNLESNVKDLAQRLEAGKKSKKPTSVDFKNVKEQLEKAEEAILQLVNVNVESTASIEKNPSLAAWMEQDDTWKRWERIKTVQLDVQKIQCVLLKLDDEKKSKAKTRFSVSKSPTSVMLRDFIHRGGRSRRRCLCGCFRGDHRVKS